LIFNNRSWIISAAEMSTTITYNKENVDDTFREILMNNDPCSFFSIGEPDTITQNIGDLLIIDENLTDTTLFKEMIYKSFKLLSSTISEFEITSLNRTVYSEILVTLLDIKKKTQINIHKKIIEISMLCITLKVMISLNHNDKNKDMIKKATERVIDEYVEFIKNYPENSI